MYDADTPENPHIPAWLIFDQRYRDRYVFAGLPPGKRLPGRWYAAGTVVRADDLAGLARAAGVDAEGLVKTVSRFNEFAAAGRDEDFGRGDSAYDRYYGDPRRANPNLAPLARPPFYAVKIVPGDLGTKGGLSTDERARVLRADGTPVEGLFAAGNASASVMGHSYAGAGATIGPAMTFGYIAARDHGGRALIPRSSSPRCRAGDGTLASELPGAPRRTIRPRRQRNSRRVAMAETTSFMIGADASCTDGGCGKVTRVVVDPVARAVTHLVVEPKHHHDCGRLVPCDLVDTTTGEIRLRCTLAEFEELDPAEETQFLPGTPGYPGYDPEQVALLALLQPGRHGHGRGLRPADRHLRHRPAGRGRGAPR